MTIMQQDSLEVNTWKKGINMFKKISEDVFNTPMGESPNEKAASGRVIKWLFIFLTVGILAGILLSKLF